MEPFNIDDEEVVLIDPGIDYTNLFKGIDLPCVKQKLINNSLNAPSRTTAFDTMPKKQFNEDATNIEALKNDSTFSIQKLNKKMLSKLREKEIKEHSKPVVTQQVIK